MMGPETLAFITALVINFVDQMGLQFTAPVIVPYGRVMGASLNTIALFTTVRGIGGIISVLWMPKLSDKRGRKLVLMLSLFGCSLGYFVQGASSWYKETVAISIFIAGRGIAGFFSGTQPVLRAYVTEISDHNKDLLKNRLVILQVASQGAGLALQPIAGSLATFGLALPFFVCFGSGVVGSIWTLCAFQDASKIKALSEAHEASSAAAAGREVAPPPPPPADTPDAGNPLCDKVIWLIFSGFFSIFIFVVSMQFLIPLMLTQESFGLQRDTDEATQQEVAKAQGLVSIPFGLCNIAVSLFLYLPMTKRCGEVPVLLVFGVLSAFSFGSYGFWVKKLWQLAIVQAFGGTCFGFLIPSVSPLIARYSSAHYRKKLAICQAIPMFGMQISNAFGQNVIALVHDSSGLTACWIICGAGILIFTVVMAIAFGLVERRSPEKNTLTSEQRKMLLQAGGEAALHPPQDIDAFIESMCVYTRDTLRARRGELWNGTAQFLYHEALKKGLQSKLREWAEESQGQEYLQDMYDHLREEYPNELQEFSEKFPNVVPYSETGNPVFAGDLPLDMTPQSPHYAYADSPALRLRRRMSSPIGGVGAAESQGSVRRSLTQPLAATSMQRAPSV